MHFRSLQVFCDVAAFRSFSRAASENGVTQSATSQIVQQLEDQLGVKLFDRSKRPFVLTTEGQYFYKGCRQLVDRYEALGEEVRTLHDEVSGRARVASIYSVGLSHMNDLVKDFLTQNPKANVRVEYQHPDRVYELVERDQADLGVVSYAKSSRAIKAVPWREEPMAVVCAPGHELAGRQSIAVSELHGREMVAFDTDLKIRREIDRKMSAAGVEVVVVMEFDNTETLKRAIEIGAGYGILPEPTVAREVELGLLVAIPFTTCDFVRPLGLIYRRGKEQGKTASRFMQLLLSRTAGNNTVDNDPADSETAERPPSAPSSAVAGDAITEATEA